MRAVLELEVLDGDYRRAVDDMRWEAVLMAAAQVDDARMQAPDARFAVTHALGSADARALADVLARV